MRAGAASRVPGEAGSLGAQLENFAAQCVITDQAITEVINFRTASGRFVDGLLIVRPYYSEDAKRGALVAVVDISARLAAEREAREIKDTVEDLVATLPMAFFRLREDSGGLPRSNVLEDYWPAARAALEESRSGHTPIQIDLPMHRPEDEGWLRIGTAVVPVGLGRRLARSLQDGGGQVMDGYAFARALRQRDDAAARLPIIGYTAGVCEEQIARARAAGMNDVLIKPVDIDALRRVLAALPAMPA
ncbi:MAG: response regulator [Achromobacter sp.]|nr:response regulator [Achromobacter sp.]